MCWNQKTSCVPWEILDNRKNVSYETPLHELIVYLKHICATLLKGNTVRHILRGQDETRHRCETQRCSGGVNTATLSWDITFQGHEFSLSSALQAKQVAAALENWHQLFYARLHIHGNKKNTRSKETAFETCVSCCFNLIFNIAEVESIWHMAHHTVALTHPARSGGRTAGSRSVAWWCSWRGRRLRCKIRHTASRERAPGQSSPPSTPGGLASGQPARTLGGALPSCLQRNRTAEIQFNSTAQNKQERLGNNKLWLSGQTLQS